LTNGDTDCMVGMAKTSTEERDMTHAQHLEELREIVAEVLELDVDELTDVGDFVEDYEADSLRAIEVLARIEKRYSVEIPQEELAEMRNLKAVYDIVARYVGWRD
jgi:acyl carrier protein